MLSNKHFLSIVILIFSNLAILIAANLINLMFPLNNPFFNQIFLIITTFILLFILMFLIVPLIYKLPREFHCFKEYFNGIHLSFQPSYSRIIAYTVICYSIFVLSELIGSLIYGQFVFDISRVLPPNSYSVLDINPGLFEEIMFRGIIFTLLLSRFSKKKTLYLSAFLFGIVHYANLLHDCSSVMVLYTTAQVIWAFGMGVLWGYLVIKTNSIIPGIILHYLSNAFDSLWLFLPIASLELRLIYMLLFAKFIPILISIILIRSILKLSK
jgi:membrane protease YdiL (CAAX protease family)